MLFHVYLFIYIYVSSYKIHLKTKLKTKKLRDKIEKLTSRNYIIALHIKNAQNN